MQGQFQVDFCRLRFVKSCSKGFKTSSICWQLNLHLLQGQPEDTLSLSQTLYKGLQLLPGRECPRGPPGRKGKVLLLTWAMLPALLAWLLENYLPSASALLPFATPAFTFMGGGRRDR